MPLGTRSTGLGGLRTQAVIQGIQPDMALGAGERPPIPGKRLPNPACLLLPGPVPRRCKQGARAPQAGKPTEAQPASPVPARSQPGVKRPNVGQRASLQWTWSACWPTVIPSGSVACLCPQNTWRRLRVAVGSGWANAMLRSRSSRVWGEPQETHLPPPSLQCGSVPLKG